jgi:hypothetical protein
MPRGTNAPGARFREFFNKVPTLTGRSGGEGLMEVIHRRCSGLDVHKETVVACVRLVSDGKITREVRTFETSSSVSCQVWRGLAAISVRGTMG